MPRPDVQLLEAHPTLRIIDGASVTGEPASRTETESIPKGRKRVQEADAIPPERVEAASAEEHGPDAKRLRKRSGRGPKRPKHGAHDELARLQARAGPAPSGSDVDDEDLTEGAASASAGQAPLNDDLPHPVADGGKTPGSARTRGKRTRQRKKAEAPQVELDMGDEATLDAQPMAVPTPRDDEAGPQTRSQSAGEKSTPKDTGVVQVVNIKRPERTAMHAALQRRQDEDLGGW